MNIFSLIYDPITATPFAVKVVSPEAITFHGLTNSGREWASSGKSLPFGMAETPHAPLTPAIQEKISPMVSGEEFIPLGEMREYLFTDMKHKQRKVFPPKESISVSEKLLSDFSGENKVRVVNFKALNFMRIRNHASAISEMKTGNLFFSLSSNMPRSSSTSDENIWRSERIVSVLGRGSSRRMGMKSRNNYSIPDSYNSRINRRVKNLLGENIINDVSTSVRKIDTAMISRLRRI
jgi:hypothetical protein